jgi:hypothetical protein
MVLLSLLFLLYLVFVLQDFWDFVCEILHVYLWLLHLMLLMLICLFRCPYVVQTYLSRNSKPSDVQDPNDDEIDNPNTVKPIFLQDQDIFGSEKSIYVFFWNVH